MEFRPDVGEQKEVYALIKSARLFVSLSVREGFGMAVLEALACGLTVLTTSAPDNHARHLAGVLAGDRVRARPGRGDRGGAACWPGRAARPRDAEGPADPWLADYDWRPMADQLAGVLRR